MTIVRFVNGVPKPKQCSCGNYCTPWWDCPEADIGDSSYNWHFGRGQNDARREAFYAKRAADPFGA